MAGVNAPLSSSTDESEIFCWSCCVCLPSGWCCGAAWTPAPWCCSIQGGVGRYPLRGWSAKVRLWGSSSSPISPTMRPGLTSAMKVRGSRVTDKTHHTHRQEHCWGPGTNMSHQCRWLMQMEAFSPQFGQNYLVSPNLLLITLLEVFKSTLS